MPVLILLLQLLAANLLYVDQMQTQLWAAGTPRAPVELSPEISAYELNPILAGHPERVQPYFTVLKAIAVGAPFFLSPDRALLYLTGLVIAQGLVVWHNARVLSSAGLPWQAYAPPRKSDGTTGLQSLYLPQEPAS